MDRQKNRKYVKKEIWLLLLGAFFVVLFLIFMNSFYKSVWNRSGLEEAEENHVYDYQYTMIVDGGNEEFWQAVYDSAREQAEKHGAYLEMLVSDKTDGYSETDYMKICTAAETDGIILDYNGDAGLQEEIDSAVGQGIPVVTVMNDAQGSLRQSFVGVNDYQLGQAYGEQVLKLIDDRTENILILLDGEEGDLEKNQIYSQISSAVLQNISGNRNIKVSARNLPQSSKFDIEEAIRMIFQNQEGSPQILVCMDETTTECAYQTMIDFNMVGEVKIIGYYVSDTILEAVRKGVIPVTCSLNTAQMGRDGVEALWEFGQEGRVNSYYNVELNFITEETLAGSSEGQVEQE